MAPIDETRGSRAASPAPRKSLKGQPTTEEQENTPNVQAKTADAKAPMKGHVAASQAPSASPTDGKKIGARLSASCFRRALAAAMVLASVAALAFSAGTSGARLYDLLQATFQISAPVASKGAAAALAAGALFAGTVLLTRRVRAARSSAKKSA